MSNIINYTIDLSGSELTNVTQLKKKTTVIENILNKIFLGICNYDNFDTIYNSIKNIDGIDKMCQKIKREKDEDAIKECPNEIDRFFTKDVIQQIYNDLNAKSNLRKMCKSKKIIQTINYDYYRYPIYNPHYGLVNVPTIPILNIKNNVVDNDPAFNVNFRQSGGNKKKTYTKTNKIIDLLSLVENNELENRMMCTLINGEILCNCDNCNKYIQDKIKLRDMLLSPMINILNTIDYLYTAILSEEEYDLYNKLYKKFKDKKNLKN